MLLKQGIELACWNTLNWSNTDSSFLRFGKEVFILWLFTTKLFQMTKNISLLITSFLSLWVWYSLSPTPPGFSVTGPGTTALTESPYLISSQLREFVPDIFELSPSFVFDITFYVFFWCAAIALFFLISSFTRTYKKDRKFIRNSSLSWLITWLLLIFFFSMFKFLTNLLVAQACPYTLPECYPKAHPLAAYIWIFAALSILYFWFIQLKSKKWRWVILLLLGVWLFFFSYQAGTLHWINTECCTV